MNLLLLEPSELQESHRVVLTDKRARHVRSVLKPKTGDRLRIGEINGPKGTGWVRSVTDATVELECTFEPERPVRPPLCLLLALPRPKVLRRLWAQIAAVGVEQIILTNAAKVERQYFDTHILERNIYRPLLIEGLQQAGDTMLPDVHVYKQLKVLIEDELDSLCVDGTRLVAHPGEARRLSSLLPSGKKRVLLAVGPEGGWTDFELDLLKKHGFDTVSMGARTLRTDTACIALLALIQDYLRTAR